MKPQDLVFYQIYPRSFCDANGDGEGDVAGIISKIPYLKDLGVNAVWISPCFRSPGVDSGYDISDYRDIDPRTGDLSSFCGMIDAFHAVGIKVILDFVANHTSTEHPWFLEAKSSKDNPYRDYYIWRKTPPNDWQSAFGGSAWEYDAATEEYYLHSYAVEQADLNWENPKVREEMCAVVDFWLDLGVDGFRCDVLDQISKDFAGQNGNGPRLHEFIRELFGREKTKDIFTVGECWSADGENVRQLCGADRGELTTVFTFGHLCLDGGKFTTDRASLKEACRRLAEWQTLCETLGVINTAFFENHDLPRAVSRFGDDGQYRYESATLLGAIVLLSRGVPFLYQGQELGLTNSHYTDVSMFRDVEILNYYETNKDTLSPDELFARICAGGRDSARRPMPWDEISQDNFWIPDGTRRAEINARADLSAQRSVYRTFQRLIDLRKAEPALREGGFVCREITDDRFVFSRVTAEEEITLVCSLGKSTPIPSCEGELLFSNYEKVGEDLLPYQFVIFKKRS